MSIVLAWLNKMYVPRAHTRKGSVTSLRPHYLLLSSYISYKLQYIITKVITTDSLTSHLR